MRDLGGWTGSAGTVKYGLIYRSGHFDSITDTDKALLVDTLGIKEEIELRNTGATVSSLGSSVKLLIAATSSYTADFKLTTLMKSIFTDVFARAIAGDPLVFHCSAGCDRTGTIAYMILALLGVSQNDIDHDYEITTMSYSDTQAHRTTSTYKSMVLDYIPTLTGDTLETKLIHYMVDTLGFSTTQVNNFRSAMLTGTPNSYYKVTGVYSDVTTSNSSTLVTGSYSATLSYASGANLSVSVTMGGTDITDSAVSGDKISISKVTGDIVVRASATSAAYTNLVSTSIDSDSTIYNGGLGYLNGKYMSGGVPSSGADADATITGYIPLRSPSGTGDVYRIKGIGSSAPSASHTRIALASNTFTGLNETNAFLSVNTTGGGIVNQNASGNPIFQTTTETGSDGGTIYVLTQINKPTAYYSGSSFYLRFSFDYTDGADLIITCNEEIK